MNYYISVFVPAREGGYAIFFPDMPEAISQGNDVAEAMTMASDVLALTLEAYTREGREWPRPSGLAQTMTWAKKEVAEMPGVDAARECLYPMIAAPVMDETRVRVMISVTKGRLAAIDEKARRAGMTRSRFLARAAESYPA